MSRVCDSAQGKRLRITAPLGSLLSLLLLLGGGQAQCTNGPNGCKQIVPHLINFSGTLQDAEGHPRTGTAGIMFSVYRDSNGGAPLWQETQNVFLDRQGHFEVVLGVTKSEGVPLDIFTGGESRWLGVRPIIPGEVEQPRVLLVSVPYALKAADAETLGGLPASAFLQAAPAESGVAAPTANASVPQATGAVGIKGKALASSTDQPVTTSGGTPNVVPRFFTGTSIGNSQITDSNGVVSMQNLANTLFADQFPGGVPDAVAACPASGCVIYAVSPAVNLNLGTIDPGSKAITIYLGPFTYKVAQITLRKGLKIIGMGGSDNGTILQAINGENPVFVIPQTNGAPATNVLLSGFRLLGSANNKGEDAFLIDASTLVNAGLWYSKFEDVYIAGFGGVGLHLKGPNSNFGAGNQWLLFNNVVVYRALGGGNGIRIEGANFELHFTDCEVDGRGVGNGTNIYIGGLAGGTFSFPFVITFRGLVSQGAALAVQLDGAQSVSFYTSHHEALSSGYQITNNTNIGTRGITIADSSFFSNVGVNGGKGFLLDVATPAAWGIRFLHNQIYGTPDSVVTGIPQVVYQDNFYGGSSNVPSTSGITAQITPAAIINIAGAHSVGLTPSTTPITTIQSSLGPGETVTLFTLGGAVVFGEGGNINLMGTNTLTVNGSITLLRTDLAGSLQWIPISQWGAGTHGGSSGSFTLSTGSSPTTATITPGSTAMYPLSVISVGGFSGTVTFMCLGAPTGSKCTVTPNPIGVVGNVSAPATATVTTTAQVSQASVNTQMTRSSRATLGSCLLTAWSALWIVPRSSRVSSLYKRRWGALIGLVLLLWLSLGCGAASGIVVGRTQAGTYKLIVTATSGSLSQSQVLTLTVQ
jgi:hypothetical protein